jgi:glycosyltransferase involved in cell wall biosynthesis
MKSNGIIILAPPWPRTGTSNLIAAQIEGYLNTGNKVYLLLEPLGPWHSKHFSENWHEIVRGMPFADRIEIGYPLAPVGTVRNFLSRFIGYSDSITEIANYAASGTLPKTLLDFIKRHAIKHLRVNHVFGMKLAKRVRKEVQTNTRKPVPIILDTHDIQAESYVHSQRENVVSGKKDSREKMLAGELALIRAADAVIHISESEYKFFSEALPQSRHYFISATLHPEIERSLTTDRRRNCPPEYDFVFIGNNNAGNLSSVRWLLADVFPHLKGKMPSIRIVGTIGSLFKHSEPELFQRYESLFEGEVTSTLPYYRSTKAVLAHSTVGTGASIKLIEALCAGKVILTSTVGIRGATNLTASDDLLVLDEPKEFAAAMEKISSEPRRFSEKNSEYYDLYFSNRAYQTKMETVRVL